MEAQEIQEKLLDYYTEKLAGLPEDGLWDYLLTNDIQLGICSCALHVFGENIYDSGWFNKGVPYVMSALPSRTGVAELMQTRINILKKLLV